MITRIFRRFASFIKKYIKDRVLPVSLYIIKMKGCNEPMRFDFMGWDYKLKHYWLDRFSPENILRKKRIWIRPSSSSKYLEKNRKNMDLAIVDIPDRTSVKERYPFALLLPRWMEMAISTNFSLNRIRGKEIRRRIRKYALEFEFRSSEEDLEYFYHKMYRPILKERHAGAAEFASYSMLQEKFRQGSDLLFISREGNPMAAQLIEKGNDHPRILTFGVLDGREEIVKMGVHGALYYYLIVHFGNQGHSSIRCGSSMPVGLDGVTQFKMRMGAYPFLKDLKERPRYFFIPFGSGKALKKVLKLNPLFHLSGNQLRTIWFAEPEDFHSKEDFLNLYRLIRSDNVDRIELCHFNDPGNILTWVEEEGLESIEFITYEREAD